MTILSANNINRVEWSKLVASSATGTWFQSVEAYEFFASMPELFKPFVIGLENDGVLRAVCVGYITVEKNPLKQFLTRRAIIIGGPALADDASSEEVEALLCALKSSLLSGRDGVGLPPIYIESRNFNDYSRWKDAFASARFDYMPHLNFHVDCRNKEAMWERMSENRRRQVRKAQATVECLTNERVNELEIREWYEILRELYRTKVKTPLWPLEFFLEAYRQGVGKFLLVKHEGKVIGGNMVVEWKKSSIINHQSSIDTDGVVYEWFECGLNAEYKEQYPSVMATWAGITLTQETGCARYDMMGAGVPGIPYGVRDFKSEFGGELVEHGRFLCVCMPLLYQFGAFVVKLLKSLWLSE